MYNKKNNAIYTKIILFSHIIILIRIAMIIIDIVSTITHISPIKFIKLADKELQSDV